MKILFLSQAYPPGNESGGIGSYVASVAPALAARGHEVHVLSCIPQQPASDVIVDGVHVHRRGVVRDKNIWAWAQILDSWFVLPRISGNVARLLEARRLGVKFDVVEAPDSMGEGLLLGLLRSAPLVGHLHTGLALTTEFNEEARRRDFTWADRFERAAIASSHVVTSPSELLVNRLRAMHWLGRRAVEVIRYPLDLETWRDTPPAEGTAPVVLTVGRLEPRKAPEDVIHALARLKKDVPDAEAVFVGDTERTHHGQSYGSWLSALAAEQGVACTLVGPIPRHELVHWYAKARVVTMLSTFDNFPMAALEGMAAGRPVVCTSATGTAELIRTSAAGAVVPPGDPDALAEALRPFLVDAAVAEKAGQEARALVTEHCAPDRVIPERERVYRQAIERWRRSPAGRLRRLLRLS